MHSQVVEEIIRSINAAGDHEDSLSTTTERSTWVAIKMVRRSGRVSFGAHPNRPDSPAP